MNQIIIIHKPKLKRLRKRVLLHYEFEKRKGGFSVDDEDTLEEQQNIIEYFLDKLREM